MTTTQPEDPVTRPSATRPERPAKRARPILAAGCFATAALAGLAGCKSSTSKAESGAATSSTAAATIMSPASTRPKSPRCEAMDNFVYDLLIVDKAKDSPRDKKDEIMRSTTIHANNLKAAAPELSQQTDIRLAWAQKYLDGTVQPVDDAANGAASGNYVEWYKTNLC